MAPPPDLRWELVDGGAADPQGALFDDVVERHIGRGEYRGMEFLHVNARRVINEVPKASRMPFRFTINAYRGCSHACVYCAAGDTPILMADGRTRVLADLVVGDQVIGTQRVGRHRRYVATTVLDHWSTVKPAVRTTLDDGTVLVTSGDHRFLTEGGWKHVTGTEHGRSRRPQLTTSNSLLGIGSFAAGPRYDDDYRRGYVCGMVRGDATDALRLVDLEPSVRMRASLTADRVARAESLAAAPGGSLPTSSLPPAVERLIEWPTRPSDEWTRGFLAGTYDAEGHLGEVIRISDSDPVFLRWIEGAMRQLGFRSVREPARENGVCHIRLRGGLAEIVRFILMTDPAAARKRQIAGQAMEGTGARRVVSVEPAGMDIPMYDITTGTGDFIADGAVSHNCFARPTHEYLGMNTGEDFDRRIVVKINAVERLRAELAPSRWGRHHIAMGTNTDPYQRCEGKYRLTQGIVRELGAAGNPFSILTKSTLILRDLELLAEAAARTQVRANFSIGTLDEEVWRLTEPGTPHPRQRVEAVAKLNGAGVPCGVLVAPVLPGLSDRPDQLEAVVKACIDAGAVAVTPLLLHLRPGVREHFLGWLGGARPDLLAGYEEIYPRAYASKVTQQSLSRQVARMVARHGGVTAAPAETRSVAPSRTSPIRPASPTQLALDV